MVQDLQLPDSIRSNSCWFLQEARILVQTRNTSITCCDMIHHELKVLSTRIESSNTAIGRRAAKRFKGRVSRLGNWEIRTPFQKKSMWCGGLTSVRKWLATSTLRGSTTQSLKMRVLAMHCADQGEDRLSKRREAVGGRTTDGSVSEGLKSSLQPYCCSCCKVAVSQAK